MNIQMQIKKTRAEQDFAGHFAAMGGELPGNSWAAAQRTKAMAAFDTLGLPHRRIEAWKYTDLRAKLDEAYAPAVRRDDVTRDQLREAFGADLAPMGCTCLVFVDGYFQPQLSDMNEFDSDIEILSLRAMLGAPPEWFKSEFGKVNAPPDDAVLALNTAFMTDGAVVRVPDQCEVDKPLHLAFFSGGGQAAGVTTRNFVIVGRGARITLMESYSDLGGANAQGNHATELVVGPKAQVHHLKFQNESEKTTHLSTWMTRIGRLANYRALQFSTGGAVARNQIFVKFNGEAGSANIDGACMLRGNQHCDTTLVVDHAEPGCVSRELYKTVLDDKARGIFQGKLIVRPDAQKTDAHQMARAVLLSETAEFDTKPELEIYADDVVCGHGATSGKMDKDLLFYLRSRGIPEKEAQTLLIQAFVGEVLELIGNENIREAMSAVAGNWLHRDQSK